MADTQSGERGEERHQFSATEAELVVSAAHRIRASFGPKRESDENVIGEAQWFNDSLADLKERFPNKQWTLLIDLSKVPLEHRPPKDASALYAHILSDESVTKVAFVHASVVQKAIVAILLAPVIFSDKVHFFASSDAAEHWLSEEHPQGDVVNW